MGENQVGVWGEYASEGLCKGPVAAESLERVGNGEKAHAGLGLWRAGMSVR